MSISTLSFPGYAPLPTPFVLSLLELDESSFLRNIRERNRDFLSRLVIFERDLIETRNSIYKLMLPLYQRNKLSLGWFREEAQKRLRGENLENLEETGKGISRTTILRWREKNWLPGPEDLIDSDRFAAILIALSLKSGSGSLPALAPSEPSFYCYMLEEPEGLWSTCPVPVPNIPASMLLWTPYRTLSETWLVSESGSIRWGQMDGHGHWTIGVNQLKIWNPQLAGLNASLFLSGAGAAARHNFANGTLYQLSLAHFDKRIKFPTSSISFATERNNESTSP